VERRTLPRARAHASAWRLAAGVTHGKRVHWGRARRGKKTHSLSRCNLIPSKILDPHPHFTSPADAGTLPGPALLAIAAGLLGIFYWRRRGASDGGGGGKAPARRPYSAAPTNPAHFPKGTGGAAAAKRAAAAGRRGQAAPSLPPPPKGRRATKAAAKADKEARRAAAEAEALRKNDPGNDHLVLNYSYYEGGRRDTHAVASRRPAAGGAGEKKDVLR